MKRKKITVRGRFHICIFLIGLCFLFISVTLFWTLTWQKRELNDLLNVNRSVYDVNSMAKDVVTAYYNYFLSSSEENRADMEQRLEEFRQEKQDLRKTILSSYYIRQVEDYFNMLDTLEEKAEKGLLMLEGEGSEDYQYYSEILYTSDLIDGYYGQIHYAMQEYNEEKQEEIQQQETAAYGRILTVCVLAAGVIMLMIYWFHWRVLRPISAVAGRAAAFRAEEGSGAERESGDEVERLSESFDHMVARIESQMAQLEEKNRLEKLLKESEIKAMQARINPHFMFNTLNSCAQMAYLENAEQTENMLAAVSDYFRYNLKDCSHLVTVEDEVKNIRDYIKILRMRFGERIKIHLDYDAGVSLCHIPALVCQPLVENAVLHGMGKRPEGGSIWLGIRKKEDQLEISVRDNGSGMSRSKLEQIKNIGKQGGDGVDSDGIGLSNVFGRLEGYFGAEFSFTVTSQEGNGTEIVITVPCR